MNEKKGVIFERKIFATGGSQAIIIPPELIAYLNLTESNETQMAGYEGKHGKYISIWKKK